MYDFEFPADFFHQFKFDFLAYPAACQTLAGWCKGSVPHEVSFIQLRLCSGKAMKDNQVGKF